MQIYEKYSNNNLNSMYQPQKTSQNSLVVNNANEVTFKAHSQLENHINNGIYFLIHQTALGRELKTKFFVRDYVNTNFSHKDKIRILSGGCSTGEEAVTYSMLFHDMKNNVDILGVDLSKKVIKQAESRRYTFEVPKKGINILDHFNTIQDSPYSDAYLFNGDKELPAEETLFKHLFKEFFEPTNRKIRTPFFEYLHNLIERRAGNTPLELDRFEYKLKDDKALNCHYKVDDIRNIDKFASDDKFEVISFNNTLYHITTDMSDNGERVSLSNAKEIIEDLMKKFKNVLNKKGIVVFGEKENEQIPDYDLVPTVMSELNFKPLNKTKTHEANVWELE